MKTVKPYLFIFLVLMLFSCKSKTGIDELKDPEIFAANYCGCMKKNQGDKDFLHALKICEERFIKQSRLYRIYRVDFKNFEIQKRINDNTRDSVFKFINIVDSCKKADCCEFVAVCPEPTK